MPDSIKIGKKWFTPNTPSINGFAYNYVASISISDSINWITFTLNKDDPSNTSNYFYDNRARLKIDNKNNIYTAFQYSNNKLGIGGLSEINTGNSRNYALVKFDEFGNALWLRYSENAPIDLIYKMDLDGTIDSNLVYTGSFNGTAKFKPYTISSQRLSIFLAKTIDYTITRDSVFAGPYCAGDTIKVPYTKTGTYDTSNYFVAELSDAFGDFEGGEYELGRIKATEADTVRGLLPLFDVASSGKYRIRIRSTAPAVQSFYKLDSLKLLIYSKDTANAGLDRLMCKGDSVELQSFGGTQWQWTPGNLTKDSAFWKTFAYPDSTTEFRIVISDSSGCGANDTDFVKINVRPPLEIKTPFFDTAICPNSSINFIANTFGGDTLQHYVMWYGKDPKKLVLLDSGVKIFKATCDTICGIRTKLFGKGYTYMAVLWDSCTAKRDTQFYYLSAAKDLELKIKSNLKDSNTFTDTILCKGNVKSITLYGSGTGGNPNKYSYSWFDMNKKLLGTGDSFTFFPSFNTKYFAVISDSCMPKNDTAYFEIYYDTLVSKVFSDLQNKTVFSDSVICEGQAITLYGGGEGGANKDYNFEWFSVSGGQFSVADTVEISPKKNEDYFIILNDNCSLKNDTFSFKIFLNPALKSEILNKNNKAKLPKDTSLCFGQTMKFSSKISGGDSLNYSYQWLVDGVQFSNADTFSYEFLKENTTEKIQFILTDNCTTKGDTSEINVFTKPKIKLTSNPIDTLCLGENFIQKMKVSGGDSLKYSYEWWVMSNEFSNADSAKIPSDSSGTHSVKIIVKDGCTIPNDSLVLDYFVREKLEVSAIIADTFCAGNTINATALAKGGNPLNYRYEWWVGGFEFSNSKNFVYQIQSSDEGKLNEIKLKLSDNCSQFSDSFLKEIFVTNPLKISLAVDSNCVNNKAKIIATSTGGKTSDYQFDFFVDDILKENNTTGIFNFADNKPSKIKVRVSDNCSENGDSVEVNIPAFLPKISAMLNPTDACEPMQVFLKINNENVTENSYNWSVGNGEIISNILLDTASYNYPKSGTFIGNIKAKTKNNCEVDLVLDKVQVRPLPTVDFTWNPTIITLPNAEVDFQNLSDLKDKFNWSVNDSNFSQEFNTKYIFNDSGFYTIKLIAENEFHCMDSSIKKLFVKDLVSVFLPNAFTPNGDGLNDEFTPIVTGIESYEIQIYNRWGQQVFEGNMTHNWNGKYGNTNVADGIFIYQIRLLRTDKRVIYLNGTLNLLR